MARAQFGLFEFDPESGELRRNGHPVHLQTQPAKVLAALIAARGELVTRAELREEVWSDGTSVDFDRGLNFAIAQVRTALGDSADSPTFIRTVPKRGYQFIAPIAFSDAEPAVAATVETRRRALLWWGLAGVGSAAAVAGGLRMWPGREPRIAVARFQNETGNPALDRFADAVTDLVVAGLTAQNAGRFGIIGNAAILRTPRNFQNIDEIASSLKVQYVILGQVQQDGARVRLLAHLIRFPEQTHLKVSRIEAIAEMSESAIAQRIVEEFTRKLNS